MTEWARAVRRNWATPTSVVLHAAVVLGFLVQFSKQAAPLPAPEAPTLAVEVMVMPPPPPPPMPIPEVVDEPPPMIETVADVAPTAPPPPPPEVKKKPDAPKPVIKKPQPVVTEQPQPPQPSLLDSTSFQIPDPMAVQTAVAAPTGHAGPPPNYQSQITAILERNKSYPRLAQQRRQKGKVTLQFVIDRRGNVLSHKIIGSSGYQLLDNEVDSLIQRVSPLPPMPPEMTESTMQFTVGILFTQG